MLLCLWYRPAVVALIGSLAWELPYAAGVTLKNIYRYVCVFIPYAAGAALKSKYIYVCVCVCVCVYPYISFLWHVCGRRQKSIIKALGQKEEKRRRVEKAGDGTAPGAA